MSPAGGFLPAYCTSLLVLAWPCLPILPTIHLVYRPSRQYQGIYCHERAKGLKKPLLSEKGVDIRRQGADSVPCEPGSRGMEGRRYGQAGSGAQTKLPWGALHHCRFSSPPWGRLARCRRAVPHPLPFSWARRFFPRFGAPHYTADRRVWPPSRAVLFFSSKTGIEIAVTRVQRKGSEIAPTGQQKAILETSAA